MAILDKLSFLRKPAFFRRNADLELFESGTGVVKWYNESGQGFLTFDSGIHKGKDIFVHQQAVDKLRVNSLKKGDRYSFKINHRHKDNKMFAIDLKKI
jgi:cold shock CspA family protein